MVYVVMRWWFPTHVSEETNKVYQKAVKDGFPKPVGEVVVTGAQNITREGVVGMSFVKVAPEEISQAMTRAFNIMAPYAEIEGYEFAVEIWGDITETGE
jgi:sugar phosphate isomerase/epimerase